jgi:hypothetical protein
MPSPPETISKLFKLLSDADRIPTNTFLNRPFEITLLQSFFLCSWLTAQDIESLKQQVFFHLSELQLQANKNEVVQLKMGKVFDGFRLVSPLMSNL